MIKKFLEDLLVSTITEHVTLLQDQLMVNCPGSYLFLLTDLRMAVLEFRIALILALMGE